MNFKNSLFTLALFLSLSTGAFSQLSISGFDALGAAPATSDLILITDVSDTTASANGTSKKLTVNELFSDPVFVGDISLRDSTTATSAKIYKTYTDASNGEWLSLDWATANVATITTTANGTGTVRNLSLQPSAGNVGIRNAAPATPLDVVGTIRSSVISAGNSLSLAADNSNATITSSTGMILQSATAANLYIRSGNTSGEVLINDSNARDVLIAGGGGNVGIGEATPVAKLDVKGDFYLKNSTSAVEQTIFNTYTDASNYEGLEIGFKDSLNVATIKTTANGTGTVRPIVFATGGTERIRINADGKIGVGTTVPTYLYQQDTANGTENWIGVRQAAQALWSMGLKAGSGTFHVRSGNAGSEIDHMSIAYTTGNVGIGDPTPSYKLDVAGDSIFGDNSNGIAIRFHDVHGGSVSAGIGSFSSNSAVKELAFYVASTTENQAMRINYLGNVGIGTTSPGSKLDVAGGVTLRDRSAMTLTAAQSKIWSQSGEMKVIDAAGNITTISPHPQELMDVLGVTGAAKTLGMDYTIPESGKAVAQPKARWLEWYVEIDHSTGQWEKKNFNSTITESGQSDNLIK
jgi:hypothetical protein